ncbi:hypothetical protein HDU92_008060 [Lobulomyces angularis]|nr:hypothetical protein HDU92_008060 [Lobulomyces angularis]
MGIPIRTNQNGASNTFSSTGAPSTDSLLRAVLNLPHTSDLKDFFEILFSRMSSQSKEGVAEIIWGLNNQASFDFPQRHEATSDNLSFFTDNPNNATSGNRYLPTSRLISSGNSSEGSVNRRQYTGEINVYERDELQRSQRRRLNPNNPHGSTTSETNQNIDGIPTYEQFTRERREARLNAQREILLNTRREFVNRNLEE